MNRVLRYVHLPVLGAALYTDSVEGRKSATGCHRSDLLYMCAGKQRVRGQERHEAGRVVSDLGEASTPFTALHRNALPLSVSALPKAEPEECVMADFYSFARSSSSQSRARSQLENMTDVDLCATRGLEQVTVQGMEGFRDKGCKDCNYDDITLAIPNPAVKTIKRGGNRFGSDHSRSSFTPFKPPTALPVMYFVKHAP